jgi:hypothetical protein
LIRAMQGLYSVSRFAWQLQRRVFAILRADSRPGAPDLCGHSGYDHHRNPDCGGVFLFIIARKIKAQSIALRGPRGLPDNAATRFALVQVRNIAWLMDSSIPIGGGYRI